MPDTSIIPSQIKNIIMEEPKSGWRKTKIVGMKTYRLGRIICLMLAISICLREKYLAKIRMTIILSGSTGSMEKNPKSNQLSAFDRLSQDKQYRQKNLSARKNRLAVPTSRKIANQPD